MKGFRQMGNGPKSGHSFPSEFGFSGSGGKSSVRSHLRSPPKFAKGGVVKAEKLLPKGASGGKGHITGEGTRPFAKGGRITSEKSNLPAGMSSSKKNITGESARPFKKGGSVQAASMPPKSPKQSAPKGNVNFQDFKKGGKVHSDAAEDRKMMDAEFRKRGLRSGGRA